AGGHRTVFSLPVDLGPFVKIQPASGKVGAAVTGVEPPNIDGIATCVEEVDLFCGTRPTPFWQPGALGAELLAFRNGHVRISQDMPGRWHVEGRIGESVDFRRGCSDRSIAKRLAEDWASKFDPGVTLRFRGTVTSTSGARARIHQENGKPVLVKLRALYESHLKALHTGDVID